MSKIGFKELFGSNYPMAHSIESVLRNDPDGVESVKSAWNCTHGYDERNSFVSSFSAAFWAEKHALTNPDASIDNWHHEYWHRLIRISIDLDVKGVASAFTDWTGLRRLELCRSDGGEDIYAATIMAAKHFGVKPWRHLLWRVLLGNEREDGLWPYATLIATEFYIKPGCETALDCLWHWWFQYKKSRRFGRFEGSEARFFEVTAEMLAATTAWWGPQQLMEELDRWVNGDRAYGMELSWKEVNELLNWVGDNGLVEAKGLKRYE